jgi:RimJ/RimL family protein N-acetyltransferase
MELALSKSVIRTWRPDDVESLARNANNIKVWRNLRDAFPHPYTEAHASEWIRTAASAVPETSFAIAVDGPAVGGIGFVLQNDIFRCSIEIGYWLGEPYWGRGITTEAVKAMTEYAFERFDVRRVYAGVFDWNRASARVLEKSGYIFEGRMRKGVIKEGQIIDDLIYAVVR